MLGIITTTSFVLLIVVVSWVGKYLAKEEIARRDKIQAELDAIPRGEVRVRECTIKNLKVREVLGNACSDNDATVYLALNSSIVRVDTACSLTRCHNQPYSITFNTEVVIYIFDTKSRDWVHIERSLHSNTDIKKCISAAREHISYHITNNQDISFSKAHRLLNQLSDPTSESAISRATAPDENAERGVSVTS